MDFDNWWVWNTCVGFPGFTRSSCASWIQAWGSIAAIGVAIFLGRRAAAQAAHGALNHYILFKVAVRDSIEGTIRCAEAHDLVGLHFGQASMQDAIHLGQGVPLHLLTDLHALTATRFRGVITHAAVVLDRALAAGAIQLHYGHIRAELSALFEKMEAFDAVHRKQPGSEANNAAAPEHRETA